MTVAIGVDLGGTKIAAATVRADGTVVRREAAPTPAAAGPEAVVAAVVELIRRVAAAPDAPVGIGSAGLVDPASGTITGSTDAIRGWAGTPLRDLVARASDRPVTVVNDVVAFLAGEHAHGAARGARDVLAVTVGTGIGGAVMTDGRILTGRRNAAGHIGHLSWPGTGSCPCGRSGHLEAVASGAAMGAEYATRTGRHGSTTEQVVARLADGDPVARAVVCEGARALGCAVGGLVNALSPALVLLGGGIALGVPMYRTEAESALRATLLPALTGDRIRKAELGADAAVVGAAELARRPAHEGAR